MRKNDRCNGFCFFCFSCTNTFDIECSAAHHSQAFTHVVQCYIIYVNGALKPSDTALGRLMSDFFCTDAKDMNYKELSDRVRFYKETEKGVETMCKAMDDMRAEAVMRDRIENAKKMIDDGKLSLEDISKYSALSLEKVRELAGDKTA